MRLWRWWGGLIYVVWLGTLSLQAQPRIDIAGESFWSEDVQLRQVNGRWSWASGELGLTGELSVATNHFGLDYEPVAFDFRGQTKRVSADNMALQSNVRWRVREVWELIGSVGLHDGFTNFRSVWLAEYFAQQFGSLEQIPGDQWEKPDPKGVNGGGGLRWEYLRASGFLEIVATGLRDEVAPGYEIDFDGLSRGRIKLNGFGVSISSENVLSPRLRSRVEISGTRVSERETRWSGSAALNTAIGERGVLRLRVGGAMEDPLFEAWFGEATWDWALNDTWAVFAQGRFYEDNGEIENALLFTSAAPGLRSRQGNVGVRWRGETSVVRLQMGRLVSDYEPTNPRTDFFQNLYRDRDWTVVQLSYSRNF